MSQLPSSASDVAVSPALTPARTVRPAGWGVWLLFSLLAFVAIRYGITALSVSMHLRPDYDANIYHLIGRAWLQGEAWPYVGLSDIKGPLAFLECGLGSLLTPDSFAGVSLLHAMLVGLGLLYVCRTAQLFLNRGAALALTGFLFLYTIYFSVHPSVVVLTLQYITLYWLMQYAREGRKWGRGRVWALGVFMGLTLALKFNLAAFWGPVCALVLLAERRHALRNLLLMLAGCGVILLPLLGWFWSVGALEALWREYVVTAVSYGRVPWVESALVQRNVLLLAQMTPDHLAMSAPALLTVPLGAVLALPWVLLARVARLRHPRALMATLTSSFLLCIVALFGGEHYFLHYFFTLLPWELLSLLTLTLLVAPRVGKWGRLLAKFGGWVFPFAVCAGVASVPWYVNHFKPEKGLAPWRTSTTMMAELLRASDGDYLCVDAMNLLHLYRLTQTCPPLQHFVPQMTAEGERRHERELMECIREKRPRYLMGTLGMEKRMRQLTREAGVDYEPVPLREKGFPVSPPTSFRPPMILWERVGE